MASGRYPILWFVLLVSISACKNPFKKDSSDEAATVPAAAPAASPSPSPSPSQSTPPSNAELGTATSIQRGDIIYGAERDTGVVDGTLPNGGGIHAISSSGAYKGVVLARNANADVLRWLWGIQISWDTFNSVWKLEVGTINSNLGGEIRSSFEGIDTSTGNAYLMSAPTLVTNTLETSTDYFAFGWTEGSAGSRYLAATDSGTGAPKLRFYWSDGSEDTCAVVYPSEYAGWKIDSIFQRQDGFGTELLVGRVNSNTGAWAIDKISPICVSGGSNPSITQDIITGMGSAPRICGITKVRYATGSWNNSIFVTVSDIFTGNISVKRYVDNGSTGLTEQASPFDGGAIAVYYNTKAGGDKDLYVMKATSIETYDTNGAKTSDLFSDPAKYYLPDVVGTPRCPFMTVLPNS